MPPALAAPVEKNTLLAGVTFRKIGKLHYYDASDLGESAAVGAMIMAQTEHGLESGEIKILRSVQSLPPGEVRETQFHIVRIATQADKQAVQKRQDDAAAFLAYCQERADFLRLPMRVVDSEAALDGQQITFYFVAEVRVDFRVLVKEVAAKLRMRVHLHQVGSRDHAKALGGYGPCGRPLCCTTFLRDFAPVSMKMAKDQSLYLNPSKFSGVCGKLMCCLRYEHDTYMEAKDRLPPEGVTVALSSGEKGIVTEVNIFRETVTVRVRTDDETHFVTVPAGEVNVARACGDCGSAGGGCGSGACGSEGGCGVPAKVEQKLIGLERRALRA